MKRVGRSSFVVIDEWKNVLFEEFLFNQFISFIYLVGASINFRSKIDHFKCTLYAPYVRKSLHYLFSYLTLFDLTLNRQYLQTLMSIYSMYITTLHTEEKKEKPLKSLS